MQEEDDSSSARKGSSVGCCGASRFAGTKRAFLSVLFPEHEVERDAVQRQAFRQARTQQTLSQHNVCFQGTGGKVSVLADDKIASDIGAFIVLCAMRELEQNNSTFIRRDERRPVSPSTSGFVLLACPRPGCSGASAGIRSERLLRKPFLIMLPQTQGLDGISRGLWCFSEWRMSGS